MDPVTAIGLASGILSFVTFSSKLINGAIKIHNTEDGRLDDNRTLELVVEEMRRLSERLLTWDDSRLACEDNGLRLLARECYNLSKELIAMLKRLKPKDATSKTQSLWSAVKNVIHDKEKVELEQKLERCRSQLELQITFLTNRETWESLDTLLSGVQTDRTTLLDLQRNIERLGQGVEISSISEMAQRQLQELFNVQKTVNQAITRKRILEAIGFEVYFWGHVPPADIASHAIRISRPFRNGIRPHHDDVETDQSAIEMKRLARNKFVTWISSEGGIFHISGKLGSGKSTLMRFLFEHQGTKTELEEWAGGKRIILAGFFFCNPGSELQKPLAGLFRSILYGILAQCPELVQQVLPEQWARLNSHHQVQDQSEFSITERDVQDAFERLFRNKEISDHHCFCIFIDGLDEFQETRRVDRKAMVQMLQSWAEISPVVKLCVSSREDNVFMNTFSPDRRFRLHELTKHDMRSYVRDKLEHLPEGESKDGLISAISERAQGIFLWASFVSKSMREEIEDGGSVESLWKILNSLPDELHDLYTHILGSLSRTRRKRAYQTLKMLLLFKRVGIDFHVLGYSFFENYEADGDFAVREQFQSNAHLVRGNAKVIWEKQEIGRKQLNGWCRGLLEVTDHHQHVQSYPPYIDYTHRSVAEFLDDKSVKADMTQYGEDLDCTNAISQLYLAAQAHFLDRNLLPRSPKVPGHDRDQAYSRLMELRQQEGLDSKPPFAFLESLSSIRSLDAWNGIPDGATVLFHPPSMASWDMPIDVLGTMRSDMIDRDDLPDEADNRLYLRSRCEHPLLIAACSRNYDYILWKLQHDQSFANNPNAMALLTYTLIWTLDFAPCFARLNEPPPAVDWSFMRKIVGQELLKLQVFTPLQPVTRPEYFVKWRLDFSHWETENTVTVTTGSHVEKDFVVSIWDHLLVLFFLHWLAPKSTDNSHIATALEVFIEQGSARTESSWRAFVAVRKGSEQERSERVQVDFEVGSEEHKKVRRKYKWDKPHSHLSFRDVSNWDLDDDGVSRCKLFTLRSWIEYVTYEEFPNRHHILELLEQHKMENVDDGPLKSKSEQTAKSSVPNPLNGAKISRTQEHESPGIEDKKHRRSSMSMGNNPRSPYTPSSVSVIPMICELASYPWEAVVDYSLHHLCMQPQLCSTPT
ncbi:hypothetical protein V8F06_006685 [Rhypophila decipiens]